MLNSKLYVYLQDAKELGVPPGVARAIDDDITAKWLSLKS